MLLRFSVTNLFCFADEAELNLVATKDKNHPEHLCPADKFNALRIAALYGANAHGKSRLVQAMQCAKTIITKGTTEPGQAIPVTPFRLDVDLRQKPTRFEFVFSTKETIYTYGFQCDEKQIFEEWLFSKPANRHEVKLFERRVDGQGNSEFNIGRTLQRGNTKGRSFLKFLTQSVRGNQLFLTRAINDNLDYLSPVHDWFNHSLNIWEAGAPILPVALLALENERFRNFVGESMKSFDTGINGIHTEERSGKPSQKLDFLLHTFEFGKDVDQEEIILEDSSDHGGLLHYFSKDKIRSIRMQTLHEVPGDDPVFFKLSDESAGTRRLIQLLPLLFAEEAMENVYVIDELDRTLHPSLSRAFIEHFLKIIGCDRNQLIFTTHESNLLDLDLLRRDEIWFVEKDAKGRSQLYPLTSFKARPDINIARGYLQGRFGAIPFIGDPSALGW
ncbi:MAG: ATP-binding protein [Magnetococcales bacterium]|nr:ATP-binding protein [Magnetococcales bacterium]